MSDNTHSTSLAAILRNVHEDLAHAKTVITAVADRLPDGYIQLGLAEGEAADALAVLAMAPSLPPSTSTDDTTPPTTPTSLLIRSLAALADTTDRVTRVLIIAAETADDPVDTMACLTAALHAGRLRDALR
ncbi:hypothetical protein GCM10009678_66440 [Actinomadura kijaniata]|uniref:Uncharacterized protein n=1 Tax=Actinomadura namibiensis TaxID=182080 RepID=A0A7W3QRC5_ACTNM|nr:hypothetical protein [Actinomadura namibiensis]MBA8956546.1 hypothetical protein [Actinomadura namibiensis]